jgi:hypothetical protein
LKSPLCETLGIEFPLFAFSHCRDVVAAVSRAGGFGVLGATRHTPESIQVELKWIDDHVNGKPYGLDVLIPENLATRGERGLTAAALAARIPQGHRDFVADLLKRNHVPAAADQVRDGAPPYDPGQALETLEAAFRHPIKLIANASRASGMACRSRHWLARKSMRSARLRPASTFWSFRVARRAVIAVRFPRWYWFPRY